MEFQQLEMFVAVVEEGGVGRAAERVCRTTAAVSIALSKLEEEFGLAFFDRSDRNQPELTQPGRVLYSYARRIVELRQEATRSIKTGAEGRRSKLRLGTHESTSLYLLPSLLQPFNEAHPETKTEIVCGTSEHLLRALTNGAIDIGLIGDVPDEPTLERHLIFSDRLVLILSPDHRLHSVKEITVDDLANEFLIVQSTRSKLRQRLAQAFADVGRSLSLGVENIAVEAIKRMVIDKLGVGFVPAICVQEEIKQGKLISRSVKGVRDDWDVWIVRRRDHKNSLTVREFYGTCIRTSQSLNVASQPRPRQRRKQKRSRSPSTRLKAMHC